MTQQTKKIKTRIGLTILLGLIVFFIFIIIIGTDDFLFSKTYRLYAYIDNATGLVKGAPVTLGGYKIGEIESVKFVPSNNRDAIKITMKVLTEYRERITISSHAEVSSIGILGDKFINITVGIPGETVIPDNSTMPVVSKLNLDNIAAKIGPSIENLNNILKNVSVISDTVAAGKGSLGRFLMNDKVERELSLLLENINGITANIKKGRGTLGKLIYDEELYSNLAKASENITQLIGNVKAGKGTIGRLLTNDSLYNNINSAGKNINDLLSGADRDSSVIKGLLSDKNLYKALMKSIISLNNLLEDIKTNPDRYIKVSVF